MSDRYDELARDWELKETCDGDTMDLKWLEGRVTRLAAHFRPTTPPAPESVRTALPEADELAAEIARAEVHGLMFASAHEAKAVIDEEVWEFWEHVLRKKKHRHAGDMRKELIQIAAMAIKAIRSMENFVGGDV